MVAMRSTRLENIYEMLENIQEYLISSKAQSADKKVLSMVENELLSLEHKLSLFTNYRPSRNKE